MKNHIQLLFTILLLSPLIKAQETDTIKHNFNEVVISASKFEEKKYDIPQPVQTISLKQIEQTNAQNAGDLLVSTGTVLAQKSQAGGGSPIIRGFEANKVLIVVDGVRMNNAIFRGGHLQNVMTIDNSMLERAEIVFGPGSVVYGSDAFGGVMHFHTKKPVFAEGDETFAFKGSAYTRYATANHEKTGHLDLSLGGKKFASLTSFTYSDFDDMRQGNISKDSLSDVWKRRYYVQRINGADVLVANDDVNIQKFSGYSQYDILQKFSFRQNDKVTHNLNFQFSNSSNLPRYDRLTDPKGAGLSNAEWYYGPQQRLMGSYRLDLSNENALYNNAQVILAYQDIKESRNQRKFGNDKLAHRNEHVNVYSLNADFKKDLEKHTVKYGIEITYNNVASTAESENIVTGQITPLDTRYPNGGSTQFAAAAYITDSWKLSEKSRLSAGLRYSHVGLNCSFGDKTFFPFPFDEAKQNNNALTGNIGYIFSPGKDWHFSLLGSTGFRSPNVDDMAKVFESGNGTLVVPNPNLKAEYVYNGELGISKIIAQKVKVEASGWYSYITNAIVTKPYTLNGEETIIYNGDTSAVVASQNAQTAYIAGASANIEAFITKWLVINTALTYTYGRIFSDTGQVPLDHIPPIFGRTGIQLNFKKLNTEVYAFYNGEKKLTDYRLGAEDNEAYATADGMPAWWTLNARAGYKFSQNVTLQVALENILDVNYRVFASGISSPGRNFIATLRVNL
ncbi:MAG: Vitamin B12 transporter BtuB [Bacteroidia bacterium]|nr:Vitamin B12 transporter BtuB [Bacteroidia bacterium]